MNFPLYYSMVFGGIFALTLIGDIRFNFVPTLAVYGTLIIWIGGLAVYYLIEANERNTVEVEGKAV